MPIAVHRKVELRRDYLYKRVHVKPDYLNTYICFSSSPFLLLVSSLLFLELFTKCNILRIYASCLNGFVLGSKWHHQYRMFCSICYSDFASFPYALLRSIGDITEVRIITATRAAYTSCCIIPDVNPIPAIISPTSPLEVIPTPTFHQDERPGDKRPAGTPQPIIFPNTATAAMTKKKRRTVGFNAKMLSEAPMVAKKTGANIRLIFAMYSFTFNREREPARPIPAAYAPTIGDRPSSAATDADPKHKTVAAASSVPSAFQLGSNFTNLGIRATSVIRSTNQSTIILTISAVTSNRLGIVPALITDVTIAKTAKPSTSSTTAAFIISLASGSFVFPISSNTFKVIAMLVAVNVAATINAEGKPWPSKRVT